MIAYVAECVSSIGAGTISFWCISEISNEAGLILWL